jgi:hypothetical protein
MSARYGAEKLEIKKMKTIKLHKRILVALVAATMILSLIGSQSFAAVDAGGDYDTLLSQDTDPNGERNYSYTTEYDDENDADLEVLFIGGDLSTSEEVPLTEADAYALDWTYNTPGADEWVDAYVIPYPIDMDETEFAAAGEVTITAGAPVGPYSIRFYVSTDPTVYADFTFVVTGSSLEPAAEDITVYYYEGSFDPDNLATNLITGGEVPSVPANGYYPPTGFDDRSYPTVMDAVAATQTYPQYPPLTSYIELYNLAPWNTFTRLMNIRVSDDRSDLFASSTNYPVDPLEEGWLYGVYKPLGGGVYEHDFLSKVEGPYDYYVEDGDLVIFVLTEYDPGDDFDELYDELFPEDIPTPAVND